MTEKCIKELVDIEKSIIGYKELTVEQLLLSAIEGTSIQDVKSVLDVTPEKEWIDNAKSLKNKRESKIDVLNFQECRAENSRLLREMFLENPETGTHLAICEHSNKDNKNTFVMCSEDKKEKWKISYTIEEA